MNWIIEVTYAILLTSCTGSILAAVWYFAGRILDKAGFANIVFGLLKLVVLFFLLPIPFIILKVKEASGEIGNGYLFLQTRKLLSVGGFLLLVWFICALAVMAFFLREIRILDGKRQKSIPCDRETVRQFTEIYRKLGGKGSRLTLCQSYYFEVPCVIGVLHPKVILPVRDFTEEEREVIFTHEIIHYLQKDVVVKRIALLMLCLHFFNPFAWLLFWGIQRWSEYACDDRACDTLGGAKRYFEIIMEMSAYHSLGNLFSSQLIENQDELLERMRRMKESRKAGRRSKSGAVLIMGIAFLTGSVSVYGAAAGSVEQYERLYHLTEVNIKEEKAPAGNDKEYTENANAPEVDEEVGEVDARPQNWSFFTWSVENMQLMKTESFFCAEGSEIHLFVSIDVGGGDVKVGLIEPSGDKRYVSGADWIEHGFLISQSGYYRIFVENDSGRTIAAEGTYVIVGDGKTAG